MIDDPPPPKRAKSRLPAPPPTAPNNIATKSSERADLNFKVPPPFHRRFKLEAVHRGLSQVDLLYTMMDAYLEKYGGTMQAPAQELMQTVSDEALELNQLVRQRKR